MAGLLAGLSLISGCAPAPAAGSTSSSSGFDWTFLIFIVVIFAVFYFLMIRPQRNRQKQQQHLLSDLKPGDQVITSAGIYGEIESMDEMSVVLKIESGGKIRVAKPSIVGKRGDVR
jgi:preprotein translocase subunit YajC